MRANRRLGGIAALALGLAVAAGAAEPRVLVYTRNHVTNGKGFVHDNIAVSVAALQEICKEAGIAVDVSDDPSVFTADNLKKYKALVFSNTNNEAFENDAQRDVFKAYLRGGGAFVGIHSATGSERKWPWYWGLIGGTFAWHHPMQDFTIRVVDRKHPSTSFLPEGPWAWSDEFYTVRERDPKVRVLLAGEQTSLKKPGTPPPGLDLPDPYPLAWCHEFEGARSFYTALGHKKEHYADPLFRRHLLGGIRWAIGAAK